MGWQATHNLERGSSVHLGERTDWFAQEKVPRHGAEERERVAYSNYPNYSTTQREGGLGCFAAGVLALVVIFVPIIGHIILTFMILADDLSGGEKLLWILIVWLLPFLGPFLYLLLGQRRNRLLARR